MKEDILEQIVEDWLISRNGCFVKHNIKFRPDKKHIDFESKFDSSFSDIDILGIDVTKEKHDSVSAVTCKSWQNGFNAKVWLEALEMNFEDYRKKNYGREKWKYFRELVVPKWTKAFCDEIYRQTSKSCFTYFIACTKIVNNKNNEIARLENSQIIQNRFNVLKVNVKIKIITFEEMIDDYFQRIRNKETNVLEATEIGRLLQLIYSSGIILNNNIRPTTSSS